MKVGVHLANDGNLTHEHLRFVSRMSLVKALVRLDEDWGEIEWSRLASALRPDCTVMLRLFFPGRLEPHEFVRRTDAKLPIILREFGGREVLIEIHNEPNHRDGIEGWGNSDADARNFREWYKEVFAMLREAGFKNLGWPGLALAWAHREYTWAEINRYNIRDSDWIGCHCYWQRPDEIIHPRLGRNWQWYRRRWPNRRVYVTEVANSSCHNPELWQVTPERQKKEYLHWYWAAQAGGVRGAAFYMLGGSSDWEGFRIYPETLEALALL